MNWKLIFLLSLFGLAMGIGTVFVIPSRLEPMFWLAIFVLSAYLIATKCSRKYFLHGLALGLANCVWITATHILLVDRYLANHAQEAKMMMSGSMPFSPRAMMAMVGPVIGLVSGVVIGLFAMAARTLVGPRNATPALNQPGD